MVQELLKSADPKMERAIEHLREELRGIRTGRASTALVEGLHVEVYGQPMVLKQVATITIPDARTIAITPWDRNNMSSIEKAIRENQSLGLNPNNDGQTIRLNIPPLTEERRREIVKTVGEKIENCHIALRNIRHEVLEDVRKREKAKEISIDDVKYAEGELNKKIERFRGVINEVQKNKELEVMEV
jgi:ribosome recycling factor